MNARIWHAGDYPVAKEALKETDSAVDRQIDLDVIPKVKFVPFGSFDLAVAESTKEALFAAGEKA